MGWAQGSVWGMLRAKQPWSWNSGAGTEGVREAEPGTPGIRLACDGCKELQEWKREMQGDGIAQRCKERAWV